MDLLSQAANTAEFMELGRQGCECGVVGEGDCVAAAVQAVLDVLGEVGQELLGQGARPGGNGGWCCGVQGRGERHKRQLDVGWGEV